MEKISKGSASIQTADLCIASLTLYVYHKLLGQKKWIQGVVKFV